MSVSETSHRISTLDCGDALMSVEYKKYSKEIPSYLTKSGNMCEIL